MTAEELYQELLLEHFRSPNCKGELQDPSSKSHVLNPLCGDEITLFLKFVDGVVSEVSFDGKGCAISQASASMLTTLLAGKSIEEAKGSLGLFEEMMQSPVSEEGKEHWKELGDAESMQGVRKFASRIRCATLAWEALRKCLDQEELTAG